MLYVSLIRIFSKRMKPGSSLLAENVVQFTFLVTNTTRTKPLFTFTTWQCFIVHCVKWLSAHSSVAKSFTTAFYGIFIFAYVCFSALPYIACIRGYFNECYAKLPHSCDRPNVPCTRTVNFAYCTRCHQLFTQCSSGDVVNSGTVKGWSFSFQDKIFVECCTTSQACSLPVLESVPESVFGARTDLFIVWEGNRHIRQILSLLKAIGIQIRTIYVFYIPFVTKILNKLCRKSFLLQNFVTVSVVHK